MDDEDHSARRRSSWPMRADLWVLAHPWKFGLAAGLLVAVLVRGIGFVWPVALVAGAAWSACVAWSMTRGPGRELTERRIERRRSQS